MTNTNTSWAAALGFALLPITDCRLAARLREHANEQVGTKSDEGFGRSRLPVD
jgi:hypothetical protein